MTNAQKATTLPLVIADAANLAQDDVKVGRANRMDAKRGTPHQARALFMALTARTTKSIGYHTPLGDAFRSWLNEIVPIMSAYDVAYATAKGGVPAAQEAAPVVEETPAQEAPANDDEAIARLAKQKKVRKEIAAKMYAKGVRPA